MFMCILIIELAERHCHSKETHDIVLIIQIRPKLTMYNILQAKTMCILVQKECMNNSALFIF